MDTRIERYIDDFDEESLWKKIPRFARRAGREVVEKVLVLYYCLRDPDTPAWARRVIMGALAYFVVPLDAIPDITPFAGFTDDFGVLMAALAMVVTHVKPEHRRRAADSLGRWFQSDPTPGTHSRA